MTTRLILNYRNSFEGKMSKIKTRWDTADVVSHMTPANSTKKTEPVSVALWDIIQGMYGHGKFEQVNMAALDHYGYAEIKNKDGSIHIGCCSEKNGKLQFSAAESTLSGVLSKYDDSRDGSVITASFLAMLMYRELPFSSSNRGNLSELHDTIKDIEDYTTEDIDSDIWDDPENCDKFSKLLCIISQNLYYTAQNEYNVVNLVIDKVSQLRQHDIKNLLAKKMDIINGSPIFITSNKSKENLGKGSFSFGNAVPDQYKEFIPNMSDDFVCPQWVLNVCADLKDSSDFADPIRNIMLTGPAGTGKTTGATAIAFYTGKPYVKVTCSPDTDMFDMVGQMLPNVDKTVDPMSLGLPTIDDIENDPKGSFFRLFGHEMGPLDSESDCYREVFNKILTSFKQSRDYTYVESNLIKAIENGWVVEIQEPNVIKRNSVLVGLNGLMENDSGACITLPTGKTIKRHRDAVVIISTNGGYDGVSPLQQSVLSRIQCVYPIEQPEKDEALNRVMRKTGFPDKSSLSIMYKTMKEMQKYCHEKDITDGICGDRELINWAKKAMLIQKRDPSSQEDIITNDSIIKAAFPTVLYKVSQDEESVEEVITAVFCKNYDQATVNESKALFNAGEI